MRSGVDEKVWALGVQKLGEVSSDVDVGNVTETSKYTESSISICSLTIFI